MSERTPPPRRIAARIVPIGRLEATPVARRGAPDAVLLQVSGTRTKLPGARLAQGSRFYRPAPNDSVSNRGDTPPGFGNAMLSADGLPVEAGVPFGPRENNDDSSPLIIWDQAPAPVEEWIDTPRWLGNVTLMPNETEFSALGQYLLSMISGFANFCRAPGVADSGNWQARLPMPSAVLPETMLDMSLSAVHARLRFETEHPVSLALLHRYVGALRDEVRETLDDSREIEVVIW